MTSQELQGLLEQLRKRVLGEVKSGRRITSVSGDGQSVTYDLGSTTPAIAYRICRNELVRRGCLTPKKGNHATINFNPKPAKSCECDR